MVPLPDVLEEHVDVVVSKIMMRRCHDILVMSKLKDRKVSREHGKGSDPRAARCLRSEGVLRARWERGQGLALGPGHLPSSEKLSGPLHRAML